MAVLCFLLSLLLHMYLLGLSSAFIETYVAIQVKPISFRQEPQSQSVFLHSNVSFYCQANVKPVEEANDYYPTLMWRFNGTTLTQHHLKVSIETTTILETGIVRSKLTIDGVDMDNAGYYECVALDGIASPNPWIDGCKRILPVTSSWQWRFITISRKAQLYIANTTEEDAIDVPVRTGEPVLLACDVASSLPTNTTVLWHLNDAVLINKNRVHNILIDGRLLIASVSDSMQGTYTCSVTLSSGYEYFGQPYHVSISESGSLHTGQSFVIVDSPRVALRGQDYRITCYTAPDGTRVTRWLKDGVEIANATSHELLLESLDYSHSGQYTCVGADAVNDTVQVMVVAPPVFDKYIEDVDTRQTVLDCDISDSSPSTRLLWYKDGERLHDATNNKQLKVGNTFGIYQCFAENEAGVAYKIIRVYKYGLSNPPKDVTCTTKLYKISDRPLLSISWEKPDFDGGHEEFKFLVSECLDGDSRIIALANTSTTTWEYFGSEEGEYFLSVRVKGNSLGEDSSPAFCRIKKTTDRFSQLSFGFDEPFCKSGWTNVTWENEVSVYENSIRHVEMGFSCQKEDFDYTVDMSWSEFPLLYKLKGGSFSLTDYNPSYPGSVCVFTGVATVEDVLVDIKPEFCFHEPLPGTITEIAPGVPRLNLTCDQSAVALSWERCPWTTENITANVTVEGRCITNKNEMFNYTISEVSGSKEFSDIPDGAFCYFHAPETVPVACVVNEDLNLLRTVDCIPPAEVSSSNETLIYATGDWTTDTASNTESRNLLPLIISVVFVVTVVVGVLVVFSVIIFLRRYYHRKSTKAAVEKELMEIQNGNHELNLISAINFPALVNAESIATELNSLCTSEKEKSPRPLPPLELLDQSVAEGKPHILEIFLNSQWNGDAVCTENDLLHTWMVNQQKYPHIDSSSGYATNYYRSDITTSSYDSQCTSQDKCFHACTDPATTESTSTRHGHSCSVSSAQKKSDSTDIEAVTSRRKIRKKRTAQKLTDTDTDRHSGHFTDDEGYVHMSPFRETTV